MIEKIRKEIKIIKKMVLCPEEFREMTIDQCREYCPHSEVCEAVWKIEEIFRNPIIPCFCGNEKHKEWCLLGMKGDMIVRELCRRIEKDRELALVLARVAGVEE